MHRHSNLILLFSFFLAGCTVSREIGTNTHNPQHQSEIEKLNRELENKHVVVTLIDESNIEAEHCIVGGEFIEYQTTIRSTRVQTRLDSVDELSYTDRIGGLLDALFFAIVPAAIATVEISFEDGNAAKSNYVRGAVVYGLGLGGGLALGKHHVYKFHSNN